jgi:hypothetical protein
MLYEITAELTLLSQEINEVMQSDDLTLAGKNQLTTEIFEKYLGIEEKFDDRACQMGAYFKQLEAEAEAIKKEAERIASYATAKLALASRIKTTLFHSMQAVNKSKIDGLHCKLSFRKNPPAVVIDAPIEEIPEDLVKTTKSPDKKAIKAFIKLNPDCEFAHIEQTSSLSIK